MLLCESPSPASLTCDGLVKFVPVRVTFTDVPSAPLEGVIDVSVGTPLALFTVKATVLLVPPLVVMEILRAPVVALAAIFSVAVICVPLTTVTLLTVIPPPVTPTVAPAIKPEPAKVTFTAVPCVPLFGVTEANVGTAALTVKGTVLLTPALVVTEILEAPKVAFAARVRVAVI